MSYQYQKITVLVAMRIKNFILCITIVCCLTVFTNSKAAKITVNTSQDILEECSFRKAVASVNFGELVEGCVNSGGSFGQGDSIDFDSSVTSVALDYDARVNLLISKDVVVNANGHRIKIDGKRAPRSVIIISSGAKVELNNLHITGGQAGIYSDDSGGGISVYEATLTLKDSLVSNNSSSSLVGGISITDSTVTIVRSEFSDNKGRYSAELPAIGGIGLSRSSVVKIINSTISRNVGKSSGGIGSYDSSLVIINSTISSNAMTENYNHSAASGIAVFNGEATIVNSTISDNISPEYLESPSLNTAASLIADDATIVIKNTIIANSAGQPDCGTTHSLFETSTVSFIGPNLVEDGSCGSNVLNNVINADPKLDKLRFNGGKTPTHALLMGSPAIDIGDNVTCKSPPVSNIDQRGIRRPIGLSCDLGSYESSKKIIDLGFLPSIYLLLNED